MNTDTRSVILKCIDDLERRVLPVVAGRENLCVEVAIEELHSAVDVERLIALSETSPGPENGGKRP